MQVNKNYLFFILISIVFRVSAQTPLEVFTEENYVGSSQLYEVVIPYLDLGVFDNNIKSFKLKQGYMATFASNSDGTGYSRVFIAEDQDLEIPVLPPYLNGTISFIRTMEWNQVTKKGWCGSGEAAIETSATNSTWRYNWDTGGTTTPATEYVPMRHNLYWPSFTPANNNAGYTHYLGYNEPDRPDQANISVEQAINGWPDYMQSGLRLGSPSTSDPFNPWLASFMSQAEDLNYRVDYMALHCYWYKSANQWANDLQYIYDKYKRPIWITEWNVGANWTGHSFPNDPNMLTDANATKHKNDLIAILNVLDNADYVERYSIYNWVQDARAMIVTIDDGFKSRNPNWENYQWLQTAPVISSWTGAYMVLTPAGEYYANNASKKAFNPAMEYISTWKSRKESLSYELASNYQSITLKWQGVNYDLVNKYVVERKLSGETAFSVFYESTDYSVLNVQDVVHSYAQYRIKVIGKDNVESPYSSTIIFQQSAIPEAPTNLAGEALSSSIINLTWSAVSNANGYNLKRATTIDSVYETVASYLTETNYQDRNLSGDTNYYYKISALNSGGESAESLPVTVKTMILVVPDIVSNIMVGSGDAQVKFEWDMMYDARYYIKRSTSELGIYTTIAEVDTNEYTDFTVENGITYYYKISAFNDAGESQDSSVLVSQPNLGQHAYYNFNENEGSESYDQWGNYDGTLFGAANWNIGKQGSGVYLNGAPSSYMDIEDGVMEGLTNFTISTWLKLDASQNWVRLFDFGSDTNNYMFLTPQNGANGKFRFAFKNGGAEEQINTQVGPTNGEWVHVAVTLEGSVGVMYIDGIEVGRNNVMTINPSVLGNTNQNYIGKSQWPDPYFNGTIDEFRIYNRALNITEIQSLANTTLNIEDAVISAKSKYIFYTADNVLHAIYNGNEDAKYRIYSITGQLISKGEILSRGVTNLGYYKTGIYIVKVGGTSIKVLVK